MKGRKKWMAFNPRTDGAIVVDRGAEKALVKQGRSLLPAGVKEIRGAFAMGERHIDHSTRRAWRSPAA